MSEIAVSPGVDGFQGGTVTNQEVGTKAYLQYSRVLTADTYAFQFPQASTQSLTFGVPRSLACDNSDNNFALTVVVSATGQSFTIPAKANGVFNIDALEGSTVYITSAGASTGNVKFIFYNYHVAPVVWYSYGANVAIASIPNGGDVALGSTTDAAITNPASAGTLISFTKGIVSLLASVVNNLLPFLYTNISTSTTTVVKNGAGTLGGVTVNTAGGAGSIVVYDNTAGSGTVIASFNSAVAGSFTFGRGIAVNNGITVVTTGAPNITVSYR